MYKNIVNEGNTNVAHIEKNSSIMNCTYTSQTNDFDPSSVKQTAFVDPFLNGT